ncbi:MAG: bifunctional folylpolyglutamate synthase/dihydrofolate synthase [Gaiellales bacterium]|nr:MAG: bifunctional folylpolyglutamate synthase/dihydrofolate synthase [Gaiellales bacterium]
MDYRAAWQFLDDLQFFKIKLGLESMQGFLASLGNPQEELRFIHVAGTNGKGSVAATLVAILGRAGYRVGLYTSPHLSTVRERFRINEELIPHADFAALATRIRDILAGRQITYFEFTTALALLWFARERVDLVVLEVGMGGRLDATNVVVPEVGIITNVTMDHEAYLGDTLAAIAEEKAGIVKAGVPLVSGVAADASRDVVVARCAEKGAPLYLLGIDFQVRPAGDGTWGYLGLDGTIPGLQCRLLGRYQLDNAALALAAIELLGKHGVARVGKEEIRAGLLAVRWPGRLEHVVLPLAETVPPAERRRYLLDGAHNPDGVRTLVAALTRDFNYADLILVWASMGDKDFGPMLREVAPLCRRIILTRPASERAAAPAQLRACLPAELAEKAQCVEGVGEALALAARLATAADLICVAGSLYLIGAAREILLSTGDGQFSG